MTWPTWILSGGSSPQMRGARVVVPEDTGLEGIIPADAGSTGRCSLPRPIGKDHPRRCGEHQIMRFPDLRNEGSSPQMRGAHPTRNHPR